MIWRERLRGDGSLPSHYRPDSGTAAKGPEGPTGRRCLPVILAITNPYPESYVCTQIGKPCVIYRLISARVVPLYDTYPEK
jgi:hypothetical protein